VGRTANHGWTMQIHPGEGEESAARRGHDQSGRDHAGKGNAMADLTSLSEQDETELQDALHGGESAAQ